MFKFFTNPEEKRQQNEEAFRVLFDLFHERVYQTAFYMTKDAHLAQDVLQETFIKAFRHIGSVTDGSKMGAWLSVIATNTAIDVLRKQNRWNGIPTDDVILLKEIDDPLENSVEAEIERQFDKTHLQRHLALLKPEYRQVLLLKYDHGLKYEEIAELLDTTVGTVKSKVHRAKRQLKAYLLQSEESGAETRKEGDAQ